MSENATNENDKTVFTKEQLDYLSSLHFINNIDHHLRLLSSIKVIYNSMYRFPRVLLILEIYYDNDKAGTLSFDLHNYEYEDIIDLAQNIRKNEFVLQEVDNYLSGDVVE